MLISRQIEGTVWGNQLHLSQFLTSTIHTKNRNSGPKLLRVTRNHEMMHQKFLLWLPQEHWEEYLQSSSPVVWKSQLGFQRDGKLLKKSELNVLSYEQSGGSKTNDVSWKSWLPLEKCDKISEAWNSIICKWFSRVQIQDTGGFCKRWDWRSRREKVHTVESVGSEQGHTMTGIDTTQSENLDTWVYDCSALRK